jgi:hypothetical protein
MKIRTAIIVDNMVLSEWQRRAIEEADEHLSIELVLNCQNTRTMKRPVKHFAYYLLNIVSLRNELTKKTTFSLPPCDVLTFNSLGDGAWQQIPSDITDQIAAKKIKLILKFGMSLLTIDEKLSGFDILSYHHGDPEHYRGRPAGFYELYDSAARVGIIIQKLSNTVDGGEVLAKVYSKIHLHSYKKTAETFYRNSQFLLKRALKTYRDNQAQKSRALGKNFRLPSNKIVLLFLVKLLKRKLVRLWYGAFIEKRWNIVKFDGGKDMPFRSLPLVRNGIVATPRKRYTFYADPFFSTDGGVIRVEALNSANGLGEVVELDSKDLAFRTLLLQGQHYSYPFSCESKGVEYLVPEVAAHSSPMIFSLAGGRTFGLAIKGLECYRLLDATILEHDGNFYMFSGSDDSSVDCCYLFLSKNLDGPYTSHPQNPIVIDPSSARMGGRVWKNAGKIYRFGQNNNYVYGNGLSVAEIVELSPTSYSEIIINDLKFDDAMGPHTIDIFGQSVILDYYIEKFSLFAGYRRLSARLRQDRAKEHVTTQNTTMTKLSRPNRLPAKRARCLHKKRLDTVNF